MSDEPAQLPADLPPNKASIALPYARRPRRRKRWQAVREFLRPDNLKEFGTTLALVVPLTLLIWIWAEREQNVVAPKRQFFVSLRSSNPSKTISIEPGRGDAISVELEGPKAGFDALMDAINKDRSKNRLIVDVGDSLEAGGSLTIPIDTLLNQQAIFNEYGLTVKSTEPSALAVFVDNQVERELPIRASQDLQGLVSTTTTTPATVKVRGPARKMQELEEAGKLFAELDLTPGPELRAAAPGAKVNLSHVPLKAIDGAGVTFDFSVVPSVSLQRSQEEQGEIRSMVVYVNKPAALEARVAATITPTFLTSVKVIGPRDVLQKLSRDEIDPKPYAIVTITLDDRGKRGTRMPTFMNLPPGVRVVDGSVQPVQFEVIESTAAEDSRLIP